MKKIITFFAAFLIAGTIMAQDNNDSPTMWIGGELTFGSFSGRDVTIGPSWGMMLGERFGVGTGALFSMGNNSFAWGIDPYARYYIPVIDNFSFYGDAYLGIGGGDNNTQVDNAGEYFNFSIGARVGLQYWFTPRWSVAASTRIFDFTSNDGTSQIGAGVNFNSVNFALFFHF